MTTTNPTQSEPTGQSHTDNVYPPDINWENEYQRLLKDVRQAQIVLDAQAEYLNRVVEEIRRERDRKHI